MTLHDERGGGLQSNAPAAMLHDERVQGLNQTLLALCFGAPGPMLLYETTG